MSGELPADTHRGGTHPALFAVLALPVLGATALDGFWMARGLLTAVVALVGEPSGIGLLYVIALVAGLQGVLITFRAWRGLQQSGAEPASSDRKTLVVIAAFAGVAAGVPLWKASTVVARSADATDDWALIDAPWFPALRLALLALSAASLALVPGPSRHANDQLWMRQLRGRAHALSQGARANRQAGIAAAASAAGVAASVARGFWLVVRTLAGFVADIVAAAGRALASGAKALAALVLAQFQVPFRTGASPADPSPCGSRDSKGWRLLAFALLSVPVAYVLLPLAFLLLEYGWTWILMIVGLVFVPLMLLYAGALVALVGLWWALLDDTREAPAWTRVLTVIAIPLHLVVAWLMRDSPDHYAYAFGRTLVLGGCHVTPPIVAALDGAVLLALHALRRWPPSTRPVPRLPRQDDTTLELVPWQRLSPGERDAVLFLEISAEQIEFAGTTARSVDACEAGDPASVAGLGIRVGRDMVGWVLLKRGAAAPDWVGAESAVVSGLRIDRRYQGRGLGTAALDEMARWVGRHWTGISTLVLRVDDTNAAGIRAYEKAGWVEVGERRTGRVGLERTLSLRL